MKAHFCKFITYIKQNRGKLLWRFIWLIAVLNLLSFLIYFACIGQASATME